MKHFQEPLTIFVHNTLLGSLRPDTAAKKLLQPESFAFLDSIVTRVHNPGTVPDVDHATRWLEQDVPALLNSIDEARQEFKMRARRVRIAFWLMKLIRDFMLRHGYKSAAPEGSVPELMIAAVSGKLGKESKYLGTMVKCVPRISFRSSANADPFL
jgi:origin recognition complex subunit 3